MRKQLYQAIIAQLKLIQVDENGNYYTALTPSPLLPPSPIGEGLGVRSEGAGGEVAIRHFDVWNNQIRYIADETPFALPAVFLQFQPIQWEQRSKGIRAADVSLTLHVITHHRAGGSQSLTQLNFFDLLDAINANLYGLKADFFRNLVSTASATDHDHDELIDSQETYTVQLTDRSAVRTVVTVKPAPVVNVSIDK